MIIQGIICSAWVLDIHSNINLFLLKEIFVIKLSQIYEKTKHL